MVCLTRECCSHLEQREFVRFGGLFCVFCFCFCCESNECNRYLLKRNWRAGMGGGAAEFWSLQKKVCSEVCQIVKRAKSSSGFVWPENDSTQRSQRVTAQRFEAGILHPPSGAPCYINTAFGLQECWAATSLGHQKGRMPGSSTGRSPCAISAHLCVWAELLLCWKGGCPAPHLPAARWEDFFFAFSSFDMWWLFPRGIEGRLPQNHFYVILILYWVPVRFQL